MKNGISSRYLIVFFSGTCLGAHETLTGCGNCQSCAYPVAEFEHKQLECSKLCLPQTTCKCKANYYRDAKNKCVTKDECLIEAGLIPY